MYKECSKEVSSSLEHSLLRLSQLAENNACSERVNGNIKFIKKRYEVKKEKKIDDITEFCGLTKETLNVNNFNDPDIQRIWELCKSLECFKLSDIREEFNNNSILINKYKKLINVLLSWGVVKKEKNIICINLQQDI